MKTKRREFKPCKWAKANHHRHRTKAHRKLSKTAKIKRAKRRLFLLWRRYMPKPRRIYAGLIARELISVEPMPDPVSLLIYDKSISARIPGAS